jgi:hypothetical protein
LSARAQPTKLMQIEIKRPLEFRLEVLETDDLVPSMRVQIRIVVAQFLVLAYAPLRWILLDRMQKVGQLCAVFGGADSRRCSSS